MTIYGSGAQRRCFTHVTDIVDAIVRLMKAHASGIFNVGNIANHTSISQLATRLGDTAVRMGLGQPPIVAHVDPKVLHGPDYEEAPDKVPDISKLREVIKWEPRFDLDAILEGVMLSSAGVRSEILCE